MRPPQGSTEDNKLARGSLEPDSSPQAHGALATLLLVQQNGPTFVSWYVNVYSATSCMFSSPEGYMGIPTLGDCFQVQGKAKTQVLAHTQ